MDIKDSKVIAVKINDDYAFTFYDEEGNSYDKDHPLLVEGTKTADKRKIFQNMFRRTKR